MIGADLLFSQLVFLTGEHLRTFLGHQGVVNEVAFSPDCRTLASGGADHDIKLWSIEPTLR